jgi:hypothetical protein
MVRSADAHIKRIRMLHLELLFRRARSRPHGAELPGSPSLPRTPPFIGPGKPTGLGGAENKTGNFVTSGLRRAAAALFYFAPYRSFKYRCGRCR